jgi:MFS family permease
VLVGVYAWVWGLGQVPTGWLADRIGRKWPITIGTLLIAAGIVIVTASTLHPVWFAGAAVMGAGMALVYPNLITAVGDTAHPSWRGGALGSTGYGATPATPSARSYSASSPNSPASPPHSGPPPDCSQPPA